MISQELKSALTKSASDEPKPGISPELREALEKKAFGGYLDKAQNLATENLGEVGGPAAMGAVGGIGAGAIIGLIKHLLADKKKGGSLLKDIAVYSGIGGLAGGLGGAGYGLFNAGAPGAGDAGDPADIEDRSTLGPAGMPGPVKPDNTPNPADPDYGKRLVEKALKPSA